MNETLQKIGPWAFVLGLAIAIILGLFPKALAGLGGINANIALLGVLGIIVALINVTEKEIDRYILGNIGFLVAASAFESVLSSLQLGVVSMGLVSIVQNFIYFVAPGLAIVCIREVFEITKSV